jgi:hypothetical protein
MHDDVAQPDGLKPLKRGAGENGKRKAERRKRIVRVVFAFRFPLSAFSFPWASAPQGKQP